MPAELQITVTPDGEVKIQVKGVPGPACEALTKEIEDALGVVKARERTGEFFQTTEQDTVKVGR